MPPAVAHKCLVVLALSLGAAPCAAAGEPLQDPRAGYDSPAFRTATRSLDGPSGPALDLEALAANPPLGLPPVAWEPPRAEAIRLGQRLFFDRRMSVNGTLSCAMCHVPEQGFTQRELRTPIGVEGRSVPRNAPALVNVAYQQTLFVDGRETSLETQIWSPLLAHNEMANPAVGAVLARIAGLDDYAERFQAVFGEGVTMSTLGRALASYQRALLSADSPFDRWYFGGQANALGDEAMHGFELFRSRGCVSCHRMGEDHALFTDHGFHDTGIGYRDPKSAAAAPRRLNFAPGVVLEVDGAAIPTRAADLGRYRITGDPADRWRFRTPGLRNVALTAPYMHDGSLATLADVVAHYAAGGTPHDGLDPRLRPLELTAAQQQALVRFLESLTGSNAAALARDARRTRIGDF